MSNRGRRNVNGFAVVGGLFAFPIIFLVWAFTAIMVPVIAFIVKHAWNGIVWAVNYRRTRRLPAGIRRVQ